MHMRLNSRVGIFVGGSRVDDLAPLEDGEAISEPQHKGNMLLND
jgi:hypothetical protein